MAARSAWSGALEFAGFPISVKAYPRLKSTSGGGFKSLCPCHDQPIKAPWLCATDGTEVARTAVHKGVEIAKGQFVRLTDEALALIEAFERTELATVVKFVPRHTVALELTTGIYALVANDKVPGSGKPVELFYRMLDESDLCAVVEAWCPRAGSKPATAMVHATDGMLMLSTLPYTSDLNEAQPIATGLVQEAEVAMAQQIAASLTEDEFDLSAYEDEWSKRRGEAVQKVLNGEVIEAPTPAPAAAVPDLMAAMQNHLQTAKPAGKKKAPAKKKATAKA